MEKSVFRPLEKNATFLSQLGKLAKENPDRPAYIFVNRDLKRRVITRQKLWDLTRKCAAIFKRLGLGKGDVVCNTLVNSPERLITYFGTLATGATPSQGQLFLANGSDLIHILKESRASTVIYDPNVPNGAGHILETTKSDNEACNIVYKDLPDLKHTIEIGTKGVEEANKWINVIEDEKEMYCDESIVSSDTAMVFVTSGTTGFCKLVPHNHTTLMKARIEFLSMGTLPENASDEKRIFNLQSLGWVAGFSSFYASTGYTRVLIDLTDGLPDNMTIGNFFVEILNNNNVNQAFLVVGDIQHVLDASEKLNKLLDVIYTGGGPTSNVAMNALGKLTHKVAVCYAATEFLISSGQLVTKKSDFVDMCAGYPLSSAKIKVVKDDEMEARPEEHGEILLRSEKLFSGYFNNPTKTAAAFTQDGWYKTGDIGYFDKEGKLFVLCRKADAINKDGFIHYPGWMEQLINKHPHNQKCIVIGIPDPVHHEDICLCYKPVADADLTTDDLREYCKKLFLTDENDKMTPLPKYYFQFNEFITNDNGKVDRKKMREAVVKRLSIEK